MMTWVPVGKLRTFGAILPSLTAGPLPLTMAAGGHGFQTCISFFLNIKDYLEAKVYVKPN